MTLKQPLSIAWVGYGDFGDELMGYALRSSLRNRNMPSPIYYQNGTKTPYVDEHEQPLAVIHPYGRRRRIKNLIDFVKLRKFETLLIGGGSLFHSENSIEWKHSIVRKIRTYHPKALVACVGVGVGPFESLYAEQLFTKFACDMDMMILRDKESTEIALGTGTTGDVFSAFDLSLLLHNEIKKRSKEMSKPVDCPVGVSFVTRAAIDANAVKQQYEYYLRLLNRILEVRPEKRVVLFTLYSGDEYIDSDINKHLVQACIAPERVKIHEFRHDIFETLLHIASCSSVLSMRLHGIIGAYLTRVPFVSLEYNKKNTRFCSSIDYDRQYAFSLKTWPDIEEIVNALNQVDETGSSIYDAVISPSYGAAVLNSALDGLNTSS